jgi:hypothetical protein
MTNVSTQHFSTFARYDYVSKPKFSSCGKSIDGARPFSMISNDRSCAKTRVSGTASTNATCPKKKAAQKLSYKEDSEANMSVMGFDRKHFVSGACEKLQDKFSED